MNKLPRILLGFAVMAAVSLIVGTLTESLTAAILATCTALVLMPPSLDPAIQIKLSQQERDPATGLLPGETCGEP